MLILEVWIIFLWVFCGLTFIISCAGEKGKRITSDKGEKKGNSVCPFLIPFTPNLIHTSLLDLQHSEYDLSGTS